MPTSILPWHSLKVRITLSTLAIFLTSLWALSYYASSMLQQSMQRQIGEQQFSTVTLIADQINDAIEDRLKSLENVARKMTPALLHSETALQAFLEDRPAFEVLFNGGFMVLNLDGTVIADVPLATGRVGVNLLDRDSIATALKEGKVSIGEPVMGKKLEAPIFHMTVPVRDAQSNVIAALSGVTNLGLPNFLDIISKYRYGKTGGYFIMAPKYRLIVTATDKTRVMEILPPHGVNSLLDRRAQGYEGSEIFTNPRGVEVLSTAKGIPLAGWYASVVLPAAEAFAPINEMKQRIFLATLFLTLLVGGLTWWLLKQQLSPLLETAKTLAEFADMDKCLQPLSIQRQDEIGLLIGGFNRVLATLSQRETTLQETQATLQTAMDQSPAGIVIVDATTQSMRYINDTGLRIRGDDRASNPNGLSVAEFHAKRPLLDLDGRPLKPDEVPINRAAQFGEVCGREFMISRPDGTRRIVESRAAPIRNAEGEIIAGMAVFLDITERKLIEKSLIDSENRFRIISSITSDILYSCLRSDDGVFRVDWMSGDTEKLFGHNIEAIINRGCWRPFVIADDLPLFERTITDIQPGQTGNAILRIIKPDGTIRYVHSISRLKTDFSGQDRHILYGALQDITERRLAEEEINRLAFFDQLTGLPNRTLLQDRLKQAMASSQRSGRYGALLLLDLDYFKTLNDTLGHDMGDLLLKQVAQRLSECIRGEDTVARFGGDEFIVMLMSLSESLGEAATLIELIGGKITAALNQTYELKDVSYRITPSIGASVFLGYQTGIDTLLKQADLAMYKAKEAGRNTLRFYDPDMAHDILKRAALDNDLRDALQKEQFVLHYQAQMTGNQVIGVEALLRWQHPERGLVFPGEFISAIEESGLILPVGQWVLETTCQRLADWATQPEMSHLTVAVNISAQQLNHEDFVDQVLRALELSGANPDRLKLELTESLLVNNVEEIIGKMTVLKAKGVGFSLDDFGTGYSSLSYLKRLPLDQLKIDQSFVRDILTDPNDAAIARMIVVLAESLGLAVIAEGVETEAQRDFLAQQGCPAYQGYLFGRPVPSDEFESFVKRG